MAGNDGCPRRQRNIAKALEKGKGAIILTGHIGNWEVGGIALGRVGGETHMVYMPDRFTAFEQARRKARDLQKVHGLADWEAPLIRRSG